MSVGLNIRTYRKEKKLTQKQLADKIGVSEITIRRYEKNINTPTVIILNKIAEALEVSRDELLTSYDIVKYELENSLLNGSSDITKLVSQFEILSKEESVRMFRILIDILDWKDLKNINDDDMYEVLMSQELYSYIKFLFFEKLNKKK